MLVTEQFWFPLASIIWTESTMEVTVNQNYSVTNILERNVFNIKKESYSCLEWHEGE